MAYDYVQTFPGGAELNGGKDTLRINIRAFESLKQTLQPKESDGIKLGDQQWSWSMLAPTDIQEQVQHTYEDYDSIQGRASQVITGAANSILKIEDVFTEGVQTKEAYFDSHISKVDSPLVYAGSERKQYSFTFLLMRYYDAQMDVTSPIHQFKRYSSATMLGGDQVQFPCVFTVISSPSTFINIPFAVLTDIQTTYQAPYINGHAQRAELTLTFRDLRPLYRSSWDLVDDNVMTTGLYGAANTGGGLIT